MTVSLERLKIETQELQHSIRNLKISWIEYFFCKFLKIFVQSQLSITHSRWTDSVCNGSGGEVYLLNGWSCEDGSWTIQSEMLWIVGLHTSFVFFWQFLTQVMFQFQSDSPLYKGHIHKEQSNEITIFDKSTWKRLQVWISSFHHSFWNVRNSRIGYFTCHQYLFYIVILKLPLWYSHFHIATMEHEVLRNYWTYGKSDCTIGFLIENCTG